jgi:hypothetical protein
MEEPSILDYLKSKLKIWKRDGKVEIPAEAQVEVPPATRRVRKPQTTSPGAKVAQPSLQKTSFSFKNFPWRSVLALVFILLAQRTFEPSPTRTATSGMILYAIGLAWVALAYLRGEWKLTDYPGTAPLPEAGADSEPNEARVRILPFVLTILLSITAFIMMGGNRFTLPNVTLWLAALGCFIWAFRQTGPGRTPLWRRVFDLSRRDSWMITVTRWTLLLLLIIGLVVFFRVYNLNGVPSEPFSDHAEKILDVYDVTQGQTSIFFPRNTGREAFQMYLTVLVSWLFGTGLSFISLKIGTVICGLATLPYVYLLGREFGGKRVAFLALLFAGIAYWPNVISRAGLRFPLYPLFVAPTLFYLIRGLRTRSRNDFIYSGIALGIGLHGYSPIRILPFVVVIAVGLYLIHAQSKGARKKAVFWLVILAVASLIIFLPLLRYWLEFPDAFNYRAFSRLGSVESPLPGPAWQVFLSNLWNGLKMFNWDDGEIWVHSVTHRPALDVVSGALFLAGVLLLLIRYIKSRNWVDLFLLLSVPLLQMPSILSLAFPGENPALNRAGGAFVPVFVIVALAMDGLWSGIRSKLTGRGGAVLVGSLSLLLVAWSSFQNYDLVFNQFARQFDGGAWNTSEMGAVIKQFGMTYGETDTVWIVPYPYWVDTRLPGVWAGIPNRDFGVWPEELDITLDAHGPKLFIVNIEDEQGKQRLEELYPQGIWSLFTSKTGLEGKDFYIYFVPPEE